MGRRRKNPNDPTTRILKPGRPIEPLRGSLSYLFKHGLEGGIDSAIEYLIAAASAGNNTAIRFMDRWKRTQTSTKRSNMVFEVVCDRSGIKPWDLAGVVIWWAQQESANISKLRALTALPEIVNTSITEAQNASGFKDRQMLLESQQFVTKSPGIVIDQSTHIENQLNAPSFEELMSKVEQPALPPAVDAVLLEAEND